MVNQQLRLLSLSGAHFFSEAGHYGPAYLLDEDVLLVTLNYRLGIFGKALKRLLTRSSTNGKIWLCVGFLSTHDNILPGNLGFKDQALGLKWVHEK